MSDFEVAQSKRDAVINNNQAVMSTKFLVIWGIAGSIFVAIVTATAYRMIVGPKL